MYFSLMLYFSTLFYVLLLQKYKLFSRWLSFISSFHPISYICGRQQYYSARIFGDFPIFPFLHTASVYTVLSRPVLGPGAIWSVVTES